MLDAISFKIHETCLPGEGYTKVVLASQGIEEGVVALDIGAREGVFVLEIDVDLIILASKREVLVEQHGVLVVLGEHLLKLHHLLGVTSV